MDGKLSEFAGAGFPRRPIPPSLLLLQVLRPVLLSTSSSLRSFQKPKLWVELENRLFKMKFLTFSKTTLSISLPWCSDLPFSFPPFTFVSQLYPLHAFLCSSPLNCSFPNNILFSLKWKRFFADPFLHLFSDPSFPSSLLSMDPDHEHEDESPPCPSSNPNLLNTAQWSQS